MKHLYKYSIDLFGPRRIFGWCFHRFFTARKLTLVFSVDSREVGSCSADQYREDLQQRKIHPTGYCGFNFTLPPDQPHFDTSSDVTVSIRESETILCTLPGEKIGAPAPGRISLKRRLKERLSKRKKSANPTFFMHIPKTGGTTFNVFAAELFASEEMITHLELYEPSNYSSLTERYRYISGHLYCKSIRAYFGDSQYRCYTILREPYAQLHSHLNWLRGIGEDTTSQYYKSQPVVFQKLSGMFPARPQLSPAELETLLNTIYGAAHELVDNYQSRHFLGTKVKKVETDDWPEILSNLALFHCVGITEELNRFQDYYCREHDLTPPPAIPPLNRSRQQPIYDHQDPLFRDIVKPLVETDLLLYNFARNKYWLPKQ